ncbi:Type I restriction-modification system specificity determinant [Parafrankia sp. Ea1.12]|uniref:restriction endonuclease subunit S n=1 Tax=Parafrankia sp. Ea1.12 TaxID=573499 RepID=UPI000DA47526|nr:restriction endonuclease subunit S [Parafrankia sp. Ea1.12]SQD98125.1 Type I restriction-modification system specificity determinant [Parafrankia sp. Ea1.12]
MTTKFLPSSVTWPSHWQNLPLWALFDRIKDVGHPDEEMLSVYRSHGVVKKDGRDDNNNQTAENRNIYQLVEPGWFIVNRMKAWQGSTGISPFRGIASGHYICFRPKHREDPRYLNWLLRSNVYTTEYARMSRGVRPGQIEIDNDELHGLRIAIPPLDEQRRIADFLDAETRRIDALTAARRRMRELLSVKKQRAIEGALGIDSRPRMLPLKFMVQAIGVGIVIRPSDWYVEEGGVTALRGLNVHPGRIDTSEVVRISIEGHLENRKSRLSAGDVVVVRTGQAGAAAVVPEELDGSNCIDLLIIQPGHVTNSHFLAHYLNSPYTQRKIIEHSVGSIQAHFNVGSMKQLDFPALDLVEQERRATVVDEVVGYFDLLESRIGMQLSVLGERRQALITAAVTGQIDVATARGLGPSGGVAA